MIGTDIVVDNVTAADLAHKAAALFGYIAPEEHLATIDLNAILFHVEGMTKEGIRGSQSQWAMEIARRTAPIFMRVYPPMAPDSIQWPGTPLDMVPPADALIAAWSEEGNYRMTEEQALKFFFGEQWEPGVWKNRLLDERPALTINWLPMIAAKSIFMATRPLTEHETSTLLPIIIVHLNRDAQVFYNFMVSNRAEKSRAEALMAGKSIVGAPAE